jgi:predicted transcriptional regulator
MEVLWGAQHATAAEVLAGLPDPPTYSAVRALLRILEEKGHVRHKESKGRYVYVPAGPRRRAARSALRRMLRTFFDNSAAKAVAALLDVSDPRLTPLELEELSKLIEEAKKRGL